MAMIFTRKTLKLLNYRLKCLGLSSSGPKRRIQSTANGEAPSVEVNFSNGRNMSFSSGRLARFANGTAVCQMGDTAVMVTAVAKSKPNPGQGFMPLVVDYRLKNAASGRIPMNFMRRELGPSEKEILSARLIDRSLRPLFHKDYRTETQLVCNMLAMDAVHSPDVLAINAASMALSLSDIPWNGPIGAVRVGLCNGEVVINPTRRELQSSQLDLVVSATKQNLVVMLEGKGNVVLQQDLLKAIKQGTREAQFIIHEIERLQKAYGRQKREVESAAEVDPDLEQAVKSMCEMRLREIFQDSQHDKISRDNAVNEVRSNVIDKVWSSFPDTEPSQIGELFNQASRSIFRELIFERGLRCDGREYDQLRNISCQVDMYKPLHGSALFQRGQTQVFCTVSLDSPESAMKLDSLAALESGGLKAKNFMLHYEFPPYATGEVGRIGPVGRRELGHGALAERSLLPTLPNDYPFTVRLTSEVLESNGSSSMASVCGGSLALMDAGVPVSAPAAGVAIGLVTKFENEDTKHLQDYRILTDILGIEDYMGDMDMKVAGTRKGFTAIQADLKIPGIPLKVVMESLQKATDAKSKILDIMSEAIREPRKYPKESWPVSETLTVEPHQRAQLIGPSGLHMKRIYLETGTTLTAADETQFNVFAPSQAAMDEAKELIEGYMVKERVPDLEFGGIYSAKITELRDTGVMVILYPSMPPALLHNSQLDQRKIAHPSALNLEVGQEIQVKYFGRDPVSGFMRLSRKVLQGPASAIPRSLNKSAGESGT
ncbi:polyribonucleotide nucleotidyltransferase 1, mitochondrial [Drosophila subpulchrella]|uniref:polyribonucleotide nucleotidyltransferase 1, mitochondrial n=1 Tax=Drosophila subpulchrella TaxID=1486046 RepID=UPI0018A1A6CE|nr:polyribonucleotide nucleotidyltransferase 1, mitochondrial [Drosophila subpulchrella]